MISTVLRVTLRIGYGGTKVYW